MKLYVSHHREHYLYFSISYGITIFR
jgi:hypothetical protein